MAQFSVRQFNGCDFHSHQGFDIEALLSEVEELATKEMQGDVAPQTDYYIQADGQDVACYANYGQFESFHWLVLGQNGMGANYASKEGVSDYLHTMQ